MTNSILVIMSLVMSHGLAAEDLSNSTLSLAGQDLHVVAPSMSTCANPVPDWTHAMLFDGGVTVRIGDNDLSGRSAVIWLQPRGEQLQAYGTGKSYMARVYLEGEIAVRKGPKSRATAMQHFAVEGAEVMVTQFVVTGEVFATADSRIQLSPDGLSKNAIYSRAFSAAMQIPSGPSIPLSARVPTVAEIITRPDRKQSDKPATPAQTAIAQQLEDAVTEDIVEPQEPQPEPEFPVHVSAMWEPAPEIQRNLMPDGQQVYTASGRFYIWQKNPGGQTLEFMADNLVAFTKPGNFSIEARQGSEIGSGKIGSVYLSGNIVMTEEGRTTRADEIYYDFVNKRALVINASMRFYDEERGLPIYLRAEKLSRVSEDIFEGQNIQLTSSEFYFPQITMNASKMVLLKGEALEHRYRLAQKEDETPPYEAHLIDVNSKFNNFTFFKWPKIVTDFEAPDTALRRLEIGNSTQNGFSVETGWHLARLMGWSQPSWLDTELLLDYYSKRGVGGGVNARWQTDEAWGTMIGYVMADSGEDRLSRTRKDVAPDEDIRGRFSLRHRQYLPDDWQLTTEISYISDRNFLESFYRSEFYNDKGQETLLYLKRLKDNWAFSILGKIRINDFETMTEELPSIEFHLTGQSFWDHKLTFYSDNQIARLREKVDSGYLSPQDAALAGGMGGIVPALSPSDLADQPQASDFYTFGYTRNEVDLPLMLNTVKLVPFVAGSYSHDDNTGFQRDLDFNLREGEEDVFLGEVGVRASTMFWKDSPFVRSEKWDLDGLRHIVTPYAAAVLYEGSEDVVDMRDEFHLGVSQRWQTHRGPEGEEGPRTLDWMRLDLESTWVSDDGPDAQSPFAAGRGTQLYGPAAFVYNDPSIPFLLRRNNSYYSVPRDSIKAEYAWRVSDTFTVLTDTNYDIDGSDIQQFNIGVSRYVYPDLSYYVGTRYLKPVVIPLDEDGDGVNEEFQEGSNSFVGAVTYRLSPRYVATFSQEYNFEFGKAIRSDLTVVRQYHRVFYAVSLSFDESLDSNSFMFSIWPQGVKELAFGSGRGVGLTGSRWED